MVGPTVRTAAGRRRSDVAATGKLAAALLLLSACFRGRVVAATGAVSASPAIAARMNLPVVCR